MDPIHLLLWLLILVVAVGIVWWALSQAPIPPPFRWVVNVVLAIIALFILFEFVAPMLGSVGSPRVR